MGILEFLSAVSVLAVAFAQPTPVNVTSSSILASFPSGYWAENIAQRPNGKLLVTVATPGPRLYQIDPYAASPTPELLHTFPYPGLSALGISEISPGDTYAVLTSGLNLSSPTLADIPKSNAAWKVTFSKQSHSSHPHSTTGGSSSICNVSLIANVTSAILFNGLATLPWNPTTVLAADSRAGGIVSINTLTGAYRTVQQGTAYQSPPNASFDLGINGLKIKANPPTVYFTNSETASLGHVPVNPDGTPAGNVTLLPLHTSFADDLILVPETAVPGKPNAVRGGGAFVNTWDEKLIVRVYPNNTVVPAFRFPSEGGSPFAGPVAAVFDRKNGSILYVSTGAGHVFKLDVEKFL